MEKVARVFKSHEDADRADEEYFQNLTPQQRLDIFLEVFNATDHANFTNPSGDRRNTADFLRLSTLVATSGLPRQAQLGLRLGF